MLCIRRIRAELLEAFLCRHKSVAVGLSGGVDSAVSAYLLKQQGYDVTAVYMRNWSVEEEKGQSVCPNIDDMLDAQKVAESLHIPFKVFDFEKEYWNDVFEVVLKEYRLGNTPNPDVLCNRHIKFKAFASKCFELGYDYLATGHYARINLSQPLSSFSQGPELLKGIDQNKDQSYFLSKIDGSLLHRILFPVGHLHKKEVKEIAKQEGLHIANKKESMGICFIGKRNMNDFLKNYLDSEKGEIVTVSGEIVGEHDGLMHFTIGQGSGLANCLDKYYVCEKRVMTNQVVVCRRDDIALYRSWLSVSDEMKVNETVWLQSDTMKKVMKYCEEYDRYPLQCQVRYQSSVHNCRIEMNDKQIIVQSDSRMRAVTAGQICVLYDDMVCLGGGQIELIVC